MNDTAAVSSSPRRRALRVLLAGALAGSALFLAGCGGGVDVVVEEPPPPPPAILDIGLSRSGYDSVRVDWSDDPYAQHFVVERNGATLASVMALTVFDYSVTTNVQYCYRVFGYDARGDLVSYSDTACIVLAP